MSSSVCGPLRKIQSGIYPKQTSISPGSFARENERYSTAFPVCLFVARKRERERVSRPRSKHRKDPFSRALPSDYEKRTEYESVSWGELRRHRSSPFFRFRPTIFRRIARYSVSIRALDWRVDHAPVEAHTQTYRNTHTRIRIHRHMDTRFRISFAVHKQ